MDHLKKSKFFAVLVYLIGLFFLASQLKKFDGLMTFFHTVVNTLLVPIILSLFLYYLLKPIYKFFSKLSKKSYPVFWPLFCFFFFF